MYDRRKMLFVHTNSNGQLDVKHFIHTLLLIYFSKT
jgi:hypothetical protein